MHVPGLAVEALPVTTVVGDDERRAVILDDLVGMPSANLGAHRVDEVGKTSDYHGLLWRDPGTVGDAAHLGVQVGRVGLVGWETGPGDLQHVSAVNLAAGPEPGASQPDPLIGVGTDLVDECRSVGVAPGLRAAGQIQDPKWRASHASSLAKLQTKCKRFAR